MFGNRNSDYLIVDSDVEAGNKVLVVTGILELIGIVPTNVQTRLLASIKTGDVSIDVENKNGWKVGDELMISPTESNTKEFEKVKIKSISGNTIELESAIKYFHYGSSNTIKTHQGILDMRAKIAHLSRNIQITVKKKKN